MDDIAKANFIKAHLKPGESLLELDVTHYLLSGHPAIRLIEIQSFGGPGQPKSRQYRNTLNPMILKAYFIT
jgi:hypothetical protein